MRGEWGYKVLRERGVGNNNNNNTRISANGTKPRQILTWNKQPTISMAITTIQQPRNQITSLVVKP